MTLKEAYQRYCKVRGHMKYARVCPAAFTRFILEPYGSEEMKAFTDVFIINVIFGSCRATELQREKISALLQRVLRWVREYDIDPEYAETAFEKKGLKVVCPSEFVVEESESDSVRLLSQTPQNIIRAEATFNDECRQMLIAEGFTAFDRMGNVLSVEILHLNKVYRGIGIRNSNRGMEFYSPKLTGDTITIDSYGILYLPLLTTERSHSCCLFQSYLDCLAYETLRQRKADGIRPNCDYIILNSPRNFGAMMVDSDLYEKVYSLFPNTEYGGTVRSTLMTRNKHVEDLSGIFDGYESLSDMIRKQYASETI